MAEKKNYEFFYYGTPSTMDANYGEFIGYRIPAGRIGAPTSIQTANQIQEVTNLLSTGGKAIELQPVSPEIFEQIPKQHFAEINKLTKLTGSEVSIHSPALDPAGFSREGWSPIERENVERQIKSIIDRAHDLAPEGNTLVNIHGSAIPGAEFVPIKEEERILTEEEKKLGVQKITPEEEKMGMKIASAVVVNPDTGTMGRVQLREKAFPGEPSTIAGELKKINEDNWRAMTTGFAFNAHRARGLIKSEFHKVAREIEERKGKGEEISQPLKDMYEDLKKNAQLGSMFLHDAYRELREMFNRSYKSAVEENNKEDQEKLNKFRNEIIGAVEVINKDPTNIDKMAEVVNQGVELFDKIKSIPKTYMQVEEFAMDKAAQTLGNAAFYSSSKYGNSAPFVSIENLFQGMAFSTGQQLKDLIDKSREQFVKAAEEKGYGTDEARKMAEKVIGATWDLGHLNILKKTGFTDKDLIEQTKKIAPYVRHVHLADNFGFSDSHLPPGMGAVPNKEILQELEKAGFKGKTIIEAGAFVQHFKTSPHPYALSALGSPIYAAYMAPFWNQAIGLSQNYYAGFGTYLPEQHFSIYGGGFLNLPSELGGQIPGKQARLGGAPIE